MENALTLIVIVLLFVIIIMLFVIIIVWMKPKPGPKPVPTGQTSQTSQTSQTGSQRPDESNPGIQKETELIPLDTLPVQVAEPSITDDQALAILSDSINDIEESRKKGWE